VEAINLKHLQETEKNVGAFKQSLLNRDVLEESCHYN